MSFKQSAADSDGQAQPELPEPLPIQNEMIWGDIELTEYKKYCTDLFILTYIWIVLLWLQRIIFILTQVIHDVIPVRPFTRMPNALLFVY